MVMGRKKWADMPRGARAAAAALVLGWILHYTIYFLNFSTDLTDRVTYMQLGVGVGICYAVATGRSWARMLCVFFNIGMVALYALYSAAIVGSGDSEWLVLTGTVALTFAAATVFLLRRDTAVFFQPQAGSDNV